MATINIPDEVCSFHVHWDASRQWCVTLRKFKSDAIFHNYGKTLEDAVAKVLLDLERGLSARQKNQDSYREAPRRSIAEIDINALDLDLDI